jgi:hypothetical protein
VCVCAQQRVTALRERVLGELLAKCACNILPLRLRYKLLIARCANVCVHVLLHRLFPRVDCIAGGLFDDMVKGVEQGQVTTLASKTCYPYTAAPAGDCERADTCTSQLPQGG